MRNWQGLLLLLIMVAAVACQKPPKTAQGLNESATEKSYRLLAETTGNAVWEKRWWLEMTSRHLRYGDGIGPQDNVDQLMTMSEADVIQHFMSDSRFADSAFDFNTYFLGFKADAIKVNGSYDMNLIEMSNAVLSAQELTEGGDYFKLFDLRGPVFAPPLGSAHHEADEAELTDRQTRAKHATELQAYLQSALTAAQEPDTSGANVCATVSDYKAQYGKIISDGYPLKLSFQGLMLNPNRAQRLELACDGTSPPDKAELIVTLQQMIAGNASFFAEMTHFEGDSGYAIQSLNDFRLVDLAAAGLGKDWLSLSFDQSSDINNSSTNRDRRRAAYMLKQFFCDDLTPVGFENPAVHIGGQHGSDTSCFACHYKLDPMAGFFRNYGNLWGDFSQSTRILFDDGATANLTSYEQGWKSPDAEPQNWNIGFIRSAGKTNLNSYGDNIADLSQILRTAPEVKQCLVRRMFEYFVAVDQTLDAGYLQNLTDQLTKESATDPAAAVKHTIASLLTSQAAHTRDMDPQTCYDFAPGEDPTNAPPCRVAYLLRKNCVSCHDGTDASGHLDLGHWITVADGTKTFPHLDANGRQVGTQENRKELSNRLSSTDDALRMPYKKTMPDSDRHELFLWAQQ